MYSIIHLRTENLVASPTSSQSVAIQRLLVQWRWKNVRENVTEGDALAPRFTQRRDLRGICSATFHRTCFPLIPARHAHPKRFQGMHYSHTFCICFPRRRTHCLHCDELLIQHALVSSVLYTMRLNNFIKLHRKVKHPASQSASET